MTDLEDFYPLSPVQHGMLFHTLYAEGGSEYVLQLRTKLKGLAPEVFRDAWNHVIKRHPVLRTAFVWERVRRPVQVVYRHTQPEWRTEDWTGLPRDIREPRLAELCISEIKRGFQLNQSPLMRMMLVSLGDDTWAFIWTKHHAVLDGWSASVVLGEVLRASTELSRGRKPELGPVRPYRDYIEWLQRQDLAAAEQYWRRELAELSEPAVPAMSSGRKSRHYGAIRIEFSAAEAGFLQQFCQSARLTPSTVVQGVWAVLLSSYCRTRDVVFGVTSSGRPAELAGIERMVGLFINTLPARARLQSRARLADWMREYQQRQAESRQFGFAPLTSMQQWSGLRPGTPLFDSLVVFENYPATTWTGQQGSPTVLEIQTRDQASYGLDLVGRLSGSNLFLELVYDDGEFSIEQIQSIARRYRNVLLTLLNRPDIRIDEIDLLDGIERNRILYEWNATTQDYPAGDLLALLDKHRDSDRVAVQAGERLLTYRELHGRAGHVAQQLIRHNVGPESRVGICIDRSPEMVIALLGVWKARGAYVPLDPANPDMRLMQMATDSGVSALITGQGHVPAWSQLAVPLLVVDQEVSISESRNNVPDFAVSPDNVAYVIHTSGSTGRPKGVMNTYGGIRNRLLWMSQACDVTASDSILQKTPTTFDVSVWELFLPLIAGARLVLADPEGHKDPDYLTRLITDRRITIAHFVPSMFDAWLKGSRVESCSALRAVICSGEALSGDLRDRFFARLQAELFNYYGPTEAAVDVTSFRCQRGDTGPVVPIGKPIANTAIYVLDSELRPTPPDVPGQLYIGGIGLARGYLNRADLTADAFVPDPFGATPGGRLYRTGDIATCRPDGNIIFLGRIDSQIKIRGVRIEPGEIEAALRQHPEVESAAVIAKGSGVEATLHACVVLNHSEPAARPDLRAWLRQRLPEVMIPASITPVSVLPLLSSGKLDRGALPKLLSEDTLPEFVELATDLERAIATVWQEVLHRERIGVTTNFFDAGGNSLLSIELHQKLSTLLGVDLTLADLFRFPTIAALAAHLTERANAEAVLGAPAQRAVMSGSGA